MAGHSRFRILDLVVTVAAAGVAFAGYGFIARGAGKSDIGEAIFWLISCGYLIVAYLVARFARGRSTQLLILGIALAFAAAGDGMYMVIYLDMDQEMTLPAGGLMAVALMLVVGGLAHGLLAHWREPRNPPRITPTEDWPTAHPLDREPMP